MAGGSSEHQLASVPLFAGLPVEVLDELAALTRLRRFPAGQVFWNEGDEGDELLVLESGVVRVSRFGDSGREVILAVVEAPASLGELALLDGAVRSASVIAQRPVMARLVPRKLFRDLLRRQPGAVDGLLKTLAGMVRSGNERYARVVGLDVPGRLAAWLLDRAAISDQRAISPGTAVALGRSQGELAAELGTTRTTINRVLKEFEEIGFLAVDGDDVKLLKPESLRRYTEP